MNIVKEMNKLINNKNITIVVVIIQYLLVEIKGKISVVIIFYTNIEIKGSSTSHVIDEQKKNEPGNEAGKEAARASKQARQGVVDELARN
jgi:hypothetical protein